MHILITGAAGMIGRKLTARLVKDGKLNGTKIDKFTLTDVVAPEKPAGFSGAIELSTGDLAAPGAAGKLLALQPNGTHHDAARRVLLAGLKARKGHLRGLAIEQLGAAAGAWAKAPLEKLATTGKGEDFLEAIAQTLKAIDDRGAP